MWADVNTNTDTLWDTNYVGNMKANRKTLEGEMHYWIPVVFWCLWQESVEFAGQIFQQDLVMPCWLILHAFAADNWPCLATTK